MDNPLIVALGITVVGMGLLFLALAFFYGLLNLISTTLRDRQSADPLPAPQPEDSRDCHELAQRAAAIAVALARAEADSQISAPPETAGPGPWWAMHHQSRLATPHSPWRTS